MTIPVIRANDITLVFKLINRDPVAALSNLTLGIAKGEFVSIVGPSGCGKGTFLNTLLGLVRPDSSGLQMDSRTITGPGQERAMVFHEFGVLPWRTETAKTF